MQFYNIMIYLDDWPKSGFMFKWKTGNNTDGTN